MSDWWSEFYDEHLAAVLLRTPSEEATAAAVDFLTSELNIVEGMTVFDQCCGEGRLSVPLLERGVYVVGVDQSQTYVESSRSAAGKGAFEFHCADAFKFVPTIKCDAAFNWWTSFGYASTKARNREMIQRAFESLNSGGQYALDFFNVPNIISNFRKVDVNEVDVDGGALVLTRTTELDYARGEVRKVWRYDLPDGTQIERPSVVQMYMPFDLVTMFADVGFEQIRLYGSVEREELGTDSPRCIVVGTKP